MTWTRRNFLKTSGLGLATVALPGFFPARVRAAGTEPVLVVVFLRGGPDGLNLVVPFADPDYDRLRPSVRVDISAGSANDLDGFFGLHPSLSDLLPIYQAGDLDLIHAVGHTGLGRSHFDAEDFVERAAPGDKHVRQGWLNRLLEIAGSGSSLQGVSYGNSKAASLLGPAQSLVLSSLGGFSIKGSFAAERGAMLEEVYTRDPSSLLGVTGAATFESLEVIGSISTETSEVYPDTRFGGSMREIAALIKADIGIRVVTVNLGGWDHHSDELGRFASGAADLGASLAAFHRDLGADTDRTLTLAMGEFGRVGFENGSNGTDHGTGGVMMALGGGVIGGRVLTRDGWPGLRDQDLFQERDLQPTTDFRDVFAELIERHMNADPGQIIPDFTPQASRYPGLLA
ncbi:MAG: DUF1501 domain-containing protein [bacterium]|nr:DUF1501 domain-containing protein [bacterium]